MNLVSPLLDLPFELDPFQALAVEHLLAGRSVVVAAPTGSGKTVVADHAVELAHRQGRKAFYTTPIKALSNQKYSDLVARYGPDEVGLLTGDTSVNGEAPIVVMTTEVLRNMIYAGSPTLRGLEYVVLDEVHYLQDPYRGPVWEEVMVHAAPGVRFVCLSATVSNADELTEWIASLRGPTELVYSDVRPVALTNLFMTSDTETGRIHLIDTLVDGRANPEGHRLTELPRSRDRRRRQRRSFTTPRRMEVLDVLASRDMLPAIVFVFSRAGCEDAASRLAADRVLLTDEHERAEIREIVEAHTRHLDPAERDVLGHDRFLAQLERGLAAHHAGMVPAFKEAVEACFVRGLVKLVFATETLALGINMPARAVVIERLTKFNGDTHEFLTPLEYTQLTGRAGRRGIDDAGYAIVLWSPWVRFGQVADLAASRDFALASVFRPSYNMAVNLVRLHDRKGSHELLDRSFGQFQTDRGRRRLERRRGRVSREIAEIEAALSGVGVDPDVAARQIRERESAAALELSEVLARLEPGHVVKLKTEGRAEPAAVLSVGYRSGGEVRVQLVGRSHKRYTLVTEDFTEPPEVVGSVDLPSPYLPNSGAFQHEVVRRLHRARLRNSRRRDRPLPEDEPRLNLDSESRRLAHELNGKRAQLERIDQRISLLSNRLARQFDDIVGILESRGYVAAWELTAPGETLRRIFNESDLAIAEALRTGVFDDLAAPELAGLVSCLTYEHRGPSAPDSPRIRSAALRERFARLEQLVEGIRSDETVAGLRLTRELDPGFVALATGWAGGDDLADLLADEEAVTGGDFVRQVRQLIDVLGQIADAAPVPETSRRASEAAAALRRGVVVATVGSEVDDPDGPKEVGE